MPPSPVVGSGEIKGACSRPRSSSGLHPICCARKENANKPSALWLFPWCFPHLSIDAGMLIFAFSETPLPCRDVENRKGKKSCRLQCGTIIPWFAFHSTPLQIHFRVRHYLLPPPLPLAPLPPFFPSPLFAQLPLSVLLFLALRSLSCSSSSVSCDFDRAMGSSGAALGCVGENLESRTEAFGISGSSMPKGGTLSSDFGRGVSKSKPPFTASLDIPTTLGDLKKDDGTGSAALRRFLESLDRERAVRREAAAVGSCWTLRGEVDASMAGFGYCLSSSSQ